MLKWANRGHIKVKFFEKVFVKVHFSEQNKNQCPDRRNHTTLRTDSSEKKVQGSAQNGESKQGATDKDASEVLHVTQFKNMLTKLSLYLLDSAPCTVKAAAGTTNAEEATRMLTERRRQARAQKELEEKKRELEEERRWVDRTKCLLEKPWRGHGSLGLYMHCRVREEQERKQLLQEQQLQEAKAREVKKLDRQNQENKEKEQQSQLEKEVRSLPSPSTTCSVINLGGFLVCFDAPPVVRGK